MDFYRNHNNYYSYYRSLYFRHKQNEYLYTGRKPADDEELLVMETTPIHLRLSLYCI